jgi:hypothetical protein
MLRPSGNDTVRTLVTASSARSRDIYQPYATGPYRQALLTLGDSALAEHVAVTSLPMSAPQPRHRGVAALLRTALLTLASSSTNRRK